MNTIIKSKPRLLLHTCCAPCFTAAFEVLRGDFDVTIHWHNANIFPLAEHKTRLNELLRYAGIVGVPVIVDDDYMLGSREWGMTMDPLQNEPEGGKRCETCIDFRLQKTAVLAKNNDFDYFSTTLTVSPHKKAKMINSVGKNLMKKYDIAFFEADFKKNNGFLKSIEICKKYNIYRQDYCGCEVSMNLRDKRKQVTF